MFISEAVAQGLLSSGGEGEVGFFNMIWPFALIFFIMWIFIIRPQNKKMQEHLKQVKTLQKGDEIITAGGIIATVFKVINDDEMEIDINKETRIRIMANTVTTVRKSKAQPAVTDISKDKK